MGARLTGIFRNVFNDPSLTIDDSSSRSTFTQWDSFAQVRLIIEIEEEFGIMFTSDEVTSLRSVGDFKKAISARVFVS